MELTRKKRGIGTYAAGAAGAAGVTAAACAACCISLPLLSPLLAWLGLAGFGALATGWYVAAGGALAAGVAAYVFFRRRRCSPARGDTCSCTTSCKT